MYYRKLKINDDEYLIAVNLSGSGAPTMDALAGMFYMDEDNGKVYKCLGGTEWAPIQEASGGAASAKISHVTILANKWVGTASPYSQVVTVEGATENSQVDLTPSVEQLAIFYQKDLAFVTENEDGVVTVYAIGQKPENDYTIQVTITEVAV